MAGNRTVLIADSNPLIRKMLCRMFETEKGYDLCAEATNGVEAIALALQHRPELIILDLAMPDLNGLDAAKELKRLLPSVSIIVFTQYVELANSISLRDPFADRIVSKFKGTELMGHVKSVLPPAGLLDSGSA
ncbi:MAG TPA: response regulator [Candidatus Acidoferrales bacterium]